MRVVPLPTEATTVVIVTCESASCGATVPDGIIPSDGWLSVWIRIEYDGLTVSSRGGWLCPDCVSAAGIRLRQSMRQRGAIKAAKGNK